MRTIRTSRGTEHPARQRPARGHRGALSRRDGAARSRSLVRRHDEGDPRPGRPDDRRGTGRVPGREPLPQHRHLRERAARRANPQAAATSSGRVPELPGDPLPLLLALGDGGAAVRRPRRLRLRRSLRHARARRRAHDARSARSGPATTASALRRDLNAGGSDVLRRLPAQAAARGRRSGASPAAGVGRRRHAAPRAGSTSRPRRRATSRASMRAARPRPASRRRARPACSIRRCSSASSTSSARRWPASTSSTTARPSCTRRRSRCASWSRRRYPHIYLYTSTNGGAFTEERVRQLVRSGIDEMTFSLDGASQDVYVRYRQRGSFEKSTAMMRAADRREAPARARRAGHQLALHPVQLERQRPRDGAGAAARRRVGRRPPVLGDHRSSLRPAILDLDGATLDPAKFAQPPDKSGGPLAHGSKA